MDRRGRILVTGAVVAALFFPVVADRDDYPLSTYPMYARVRGSTVSLATAQGVDAAGGPITLSLGLIGESDDPLVVAGELRDAIADGRAEQRCREIAGRLERSGRAADEPGAVAVEVVIERHDVVARISGDAPGLVDRVVHARCAVAP